MRSECPTPQGYSDRAFRAMPFKSLFGFSRLMQSYGVPSEAWQVTDKAELTSIPPPLLAREGGRFVIVRSFGRDAAGATTVNFCCYGRSVTLPLERGRHHLLRSQHRHTAALPGRNPHLSAHQRLLPAVHPMEHPLSEVQDTHLVHSVRHHPDTAVAAVFLFPFRRLVEHRDLATAAVADTDNSYLRGSADGSQPCYDLHQRTNSLLAVIR